MLGPAPDSRFAAISVAWKTRPTEYVDNFVEKPWDKGLRAASGKGWNRVALKQAYKNLMKSMGCNELPRYFRSQWALVGEFPASLRLWSNVQVVALGKAH